MTSAIREQMRTPMPAVSDELTLIASFMLATAGLAHLSVAPAHFGEWWWFGALFLLAAGLQMGLALGLLLRPSRANFTAGVVVSCALIAVWTLSRSSGLPLGPEPGAEEGIGALDLLTTLDEIALVVLAAVALLGPGWMRSRRLVLACEDSGVALGVVLTLAFAGGHG